MLETEGQYSKKILFTAFGADKTAIVNQLTVGVKVEVSFNIESKEHNGKWFTSLTTWKVEQAGQSNSTSSKSERNLSNEEDDLPF